RSGTPCPWRAEVGAGARQGHGVPDRELPRLAATATAAGRKRHRSARDAYRKNHQPEPSHQLSSLVHTSHPLSRPLPGRSCSSERYPYLPYRGSAVLGLERAFHPPSSYADWLGARCPPPPAPTRRHWAIFPSRITNEVLAMPPVPGPQAPGPGRSVRRKVAVVNWPAVSARTRSAPQGSDSLNRRESARLP